jgi:hypothetical protein
MQICPEFMNAPKTAASTARSGSASSRMISGFFPEIGQEQLPT